MNDAVGGQAAELFAGHSFHRVRAPVGANVRKDLGGVAQQVAEEHGRPVQEVVFRGDDIGLANAVPVEGGVQHGFQEIAVGEVVRPLPLALKSGGDGIMTQGLLAKPQFFQLRDCRP